MILPFTVSKLTVRSRASISPVVLLKLMSPVVPVSATAISLDRPGATRCARILPALVSVILPVTPDAAMANESSAMIDAPPALASVMSPLTPFNKMAFWPVAFISRAPEAVVTISPLAFTT